MINFWLEIAYLNFCKAVMHGQVQDDQGADREIEQVLTKQQSDQVSDMNARHQGEMFKLLRGFVVLP